MTVTLNSGLCLLLCKGKIDLQKLVPLLNFGCRRPKWGYPHIQSSPCNGWFDPTCLTDREILNGPAIHLISSFGTYTESPGFKKNPNVVYATNISNITNFSERLKDRTLRKYNLVNSFNVKTDFKRYKVLQGTTCVWKIKIFGKNLPCMLLIR